jgi:PilZ domain
MAIRWAETLNTKESLNIRFTLPPSTEQITVTGEVAWQDRNGGLGIRFVDTPHASRRALKEWVSANTQKGEANPYALGRAPLSQG